MKKLISLLAFTILLAPDVHSQTFSDLGGGTNLICVYYPNGKTAVGRKAGNGYKTTSFNREIDALKKSKTKASQALKVLNKMINRLKKQLNTVGPEIKWKLTKEELKVLSPFIKSGRYDPKASPVLGANLEILQQIRDEVAGSVASTQNIIDRVKDCLKKRLPTPGTFPLIYGAIKQHDWKPATDSAGSGYVGVFAVIPYSYVAANQHYFCFERPAGQSGGTIAESGLTNPCYQKTLSNLPNACEHLLTRDAKGNLTTVVALLAIRNFFFQEREGAQTFAQAAGRYEAELRNTGWGNDVRFAVRKGSVDSCNSAKFE